MPGWVLCTALLAGCATRPVAVAPPDRLPPAQMQAFDLSGRISARQADQGFYGNFRWRVADRVHDITLLSPLGQAVARVVTDDSGVTLMTGKETVHADSAAALTRDALGVAIPVEGLEYWIKGDKAPGPAVADRRPDGTLVRLMQNDWQIDYDRYSARGNTWLPGRLTLSRGDVIIKLVIDDWHVHPAAQ